MIVALSILKRTEEILGKYQRNMLQSRIDAGHLFFLFLPLCSVAFTYVVVRYSILRERCCGFRCSPAVWLRLAFLFCFSWDVRKWYRMPLPKRTLTVKRNDVASHEIESCCSYGASSKTYDARCSHSSAHEGEDFETAPRQSEDLPFYDRALKFNDIALTDGIILTAIFNVMSGVKFESCESQGAWSHSEQGH